MKEGPGPKVQHIAPTVVSPTKRQDERGNLILLSSNSIFNERGPIQRGLWGVGHTHTHTLSVTKGFQRGDVTTPTPNPLPPGSVTELYYCLHFHAHLFVQRR